MIHYTSSDNVHYEIWTDKGNVESEKKVKKTGTVDKPKTGKIMHRLFYLSLAYQCQFFSFNKRNEPGITSQNKNFIAMSTFQYGE